MAIIERTKQKVSTKLLPTLTVRQTFGKWNGWGHRAHHIELLQLSSINSSELHELLEKELAFSLDVAQTFMKHLKTS